MVSQLLPAARNSAATAIMVRMEGGACVLMRNLARRKRWRRGWTTRRCAGGTGNASHMGYYILYRIICQEAGREFGAQVGQLGSRSSDQPIALRITGVAFGANGPAMPPVCLLGKQAVLKRPPRPGDDGGGAKHRSGAEATMDKLGREVIKIAATVSLALLLGTGPVQAQGLGGSSPRIPMQATKFMQQRAFQQHAMPQNGAQPYVASQNALPPNSYQQNAYQQYAYQQNAFQQAAFQQLALQQALLQQAALQQLAMQQAAFQQLQMQAAMQQLQQFNGAGAGQRP